MKADRRSYRIILIRGDGIGPELIDATQAVVAAAQEFRRTVQLDFEEHPGGAGLYEREGTRLRPATLQAMREAATTLKGPVGLPEVRLPDGTEAGLLGGVLRTGLDTYANVRPIRLLPAIQAPINTDVNGIDYVIVRENTEGLYLSRGKGVGMEEAMSDTMLVTRKGSERVALFAFELACRRRGARSDGKHRVTCVDKSNVLASYAFFRRVFDPVGDAYPDIEREYLYADAAAEAPVMRPQSFDVLVTENFLGDILSDLGGGTIGGIGLCPSGNIGDENSYFEPIHGSGPDIAGQDRANPISQILSAAQMLEHLGEIEMGGSSRRAVDESLTSGRLKIGARGQPEGGTQKAGQTIAELLRQAGD